MPNTGKATNVTMKRSLTTVNGKQVYKFTLTWKHGSPDFKKYCDVGAILSTQAEGEVKYGKASQFTMNTAKTSATLNRYFTLENYYPYKNNYLWRIEMNVVGCAKTPANSPVTYYLSDPAKVKWIMQDPNKPTNVKGTLDSENDNVTVFSWTQNYSETDNKPFARNTWETVLLEECNVKDPPTYSGGYRVQWTTLGHSKSTRSATITETNLSISKSYTRWFRVRAEGMSGYSDYVYAKHVYATPNAPTVTKAEFTKGVSNNHTVVNFQLSSSYARPIDTVEVGYLVDVPEIGGVCPDSTFTYKNPLKYKQSKMSDEITTETGIPKDNCMWVRVKANHDRRSAWSEPVLVTNGGVKEPVLTSQAATTSTTVDIVCENKSDIEDSFMVVWITLVSNPSVKYAVGVLDHGATSETVTTMDLTGESYRIGLQAVTGTYSTVTHTDWTEYVITPRMESKIVWSSNATIAQPPNTLTATALDTTSVRLTWDWPWADATKAVVSWADHENAWESTEQPDEFVIERKVSSWDVGGLESDSTYWFRVKLQSDTLESIWSDPVSLSLAESPTVPTLSAAESIVSLDDTLYLSAGATGTGNYVYQVVEWNTTNDTPLTDAILTSVGVESMSIAISDINQIYESKQATASYTWDSGETHHLAVRAVPEGGEPSVWSAPIPITVVTEPAITSVTTNLTTETVTEGDVTRAVNVLGALPLTVTVAGTDISRTLVEVKRATSYPAPRPDERNAMKYEGDVVGAQAIDGTGQVTFDNFNGELDDGVPFLIQVTAYGEKSEVVQTLEFEPHYTHQPMAPEVTAEVLEGFEVFVITPEFPSGYTSATGDVCDIYRLSLDKPELIYQNAEYDEDYVDQYPTFGENGGYIVAAKTANGDTIDEDDTPAWTYVYGGLEGHEVVRIDFNNDYVDLPYNLDLSNTWSKDFQRTEYLGGSVQGDWNPAVTRDLSVGTVGVSTIEGDDTDVRMRRLADYAGICHVRTPEGSSFAADVQVKESQGTDGRKIDWSLDIKKVDPEGYDGMTLDAWNEQNEEES